MTVRYTAQGCKVETTCVIQPNGTYTEEVVLSVDQGSALAISVEESAGQAIGSAPRVPKNMRVKATKFGFELVERK